MGRWEVSGADRKTGVDKAIVIDANDEAQAIRRGNRAGIMVDAARPIDADDSSAGMLVAHVQSRLAPSVSNPQKIHVQHQVPGAIKVELKGTSGLGVAALVIGIIAVLGSWIPFVGLLSIPLAILGIILGGIGLAISLVGRKSSAGMPVAGLTTCLLAIFVAVAVTGATAKAIDDSVKAGSHASSQQPIVASATEIAAPTVSAAPPQEKWLDGFAGATKGDIAVRVVSATIGRVGVKSKITGDTSTSKDALLAIKLQIHNRSASRKVDYKTWAGADFSVARDYASLEDEHGNTYKRTGFGLADKVIDSVDRESVYPGKSIFDVLVFEEPITAATNLKLELPAENFGDKGVIRLEFPASKAERN